MSRTRNNPLADVDVAGRILRDGVHIRKGCGQRIGAVGPTSGTAAGDFAGFPVAVAGKTGTGEVFGLNSNGTKKNSTSWFASFAPVENPQYAVVVMVSQGGTGAAAAGVGAGVFDVDVLPTSAPIDPPFTGAMFLLLP